MVSLKLTIKSVLIKGIASLGRRFRHTSLASSSLLNRLHANVSLWLHGTDCVNMGPFMVRFDRRDQVIAKKMVLYQEFEQQEIDILCSWVTPGDQVLDIGANIGIYTLYLSQAVGPNGRVIAVEPDPGNLQILRDNIELNHCQNIIVLPCAFGATSGEVELYQSETNRGQLSLRDIGQTGHSVKVRLCRGENALGELGGSFRLAKIDVEGYEPFVINGLGCYKPDLIMFEFYLPYFEAFNVDPHTFLTSLIAEGYSLRLVSSPEILSIQTPVELIAFSRHHKQACNILASRVTKFGNSI